MERAESHIVHSAPAQGDEFRYHIHNVGGIKYLLYGQLVYHCPFLLLTPKLQKKQCSGERTVLLLYF